MNTVGEGDEIHPTLKTIGKKMTDEKINFISNFNLVN